MLSDFHETAARGKELKYRGAVRHAYTVLQISCEETVHLKAHYCLARAMVLEVGN